MNLRHKENVLNNCGLHLLFIAYLNLKRSSVIKGSSDDIILLVFFGVEIIYEFICFRFSFFTGFSYWH